MTALEYIEVYKKKPMSNEKKSNEIWLSEFAESYHQYRKNRYWIVRILKL